MIKIKTLLLAAACLLIVNTGFSQKQLPPAGGTPKNFTLPGKTTKKLANGFRTTTVQYGSVPKVSINLIISTGSVNELASETGLADLTGKLMSQGSVKMDFKTLSKKVAGMGGTVNVSVGKEEIYIAGSVLSEFAPDFIAAVADLVINPAFPAAELERLKADMKRELNVSKTVPQEIAQSKFREALFKDHPYGRYFSTEEKINSFTLQKVKDFYTKNVGAKRSALYVAGKFDEAKVNVAIDKAFSKWRSGLDVTAPPLPQMTKQENIIIDRKDAPQTTIMLGLPVIKPKDQDFTALLITNSLLGGSFGSRITSNIRENKGYTYSPFSTVLNRRLASVWYEQADVTAEHTVESLQEIEKEIKRLQTEPPSAEELSGIQNYEAGIFVLQNSTPDGIIGQLQFLDKHGLPDSYLTNKVKNMYSVTPAKVSEMTKKYFDYSKMTTVMVGDEKSIKKQIAEKAPKKGF
jgi:zinc protease